MLKDLSPVDLERPSIRWPGGHLSTARSRPASLASNGGSIARSVYTREVAT